MAREKAPEVTALDQPNSVSSGLKKTPNELCMPKDSVIMKKAATITI